MDGTHEQLPLRRAVATDADALAERARRAYASWVPVLGREPRPMVADYAEMLKDHRIDPHEAGDALIGSIATKIAPDHLFIESVALEAGLNEVRLLTNGLMEANVTLYSRNGYVICAREQHPVCGTVIYMRKRVS